MAGSRIPGAATRDANVLIDREEHLLEVGANLRESDPEQFDPAVQELRAQWLAASELYDLRLRQLENDPELDPRSPLKPEVREALAQPPAPQ